MTLDFYFARRFGWAFAMVTAIFIGLLMLTEILEQLRIFGTEKLGFMGLLEMSALRLGPGIYDLLPIVIILATLVHYLGLARSSELVVTRAAGRSALRAIVPALVMSIVIGLLTVAVLNPISSASQRSYELRKTALLGGTTQAFSVSEEGLWLREGNAEGQVVIRAGRGNFNGTILSDVTFLGFGPEGQMEYRIEAEQAQINPNEWALRDAKYWPLGANSANPEADATLHDHLSVPTQLTAEEIRDRFGKTATVPIWSLLAHIDKLEAAGFSARSFRMQFQSELALPATFLAMVLIGAGFTMRHTRLGGTSSRVLTALLLAFGFFFLRNFARILGENGEVPVVLAAWGPPVAVILAAFALLLHLEDG